MDSASLAFIDDYLVESSHALLAFTQDNAARGVMGAIADTMTGALRRGGKILLAGNGGSAADAQHIAGEFVSRLFFDHAPLPAIALTTDTSVLTAIGNDYGYERVFERQLLALARRGDVFLGISTSGKSPNILRALDAARSAGVIALGFTGMGDGPMGEKCDLVLRAPSRNTPIIQQIHIIAAHLVCGLVERQMFSNPMAQAAQ